MFEKPFLLLIRGYRLLFSPWVGHNCRFLPTCSEYSYTALDRFGLIKGLWLTFFRLLRCQPFGTPGIDEVPEKFRWKCWCRNCQNQNNSDFIFQPQLEKTNHGK